MRATAAQCNLCDQYGWISTRRPDTRLRASTARPEIWMTRPPDDKPRGRPAIPVWGGAPNPFHGQVGTNSAHNMCVGVSFTK